ncbi:hypothetical protein PM082_012649 [Marasmius tenuissimus]|nr:hypothetical protein PM082_012649 [Marasmius tenuissimus]
MSGPRSRIRMWQGLMKKFTPPQSRGRIASTIVCRGLDRHSRQSRRNTALVLEKADGIHHGRAEDPERKLKGEQVVTLDSSLEMRKRPCDRPHARFSPPTSLQR